MNTRSSSTIRSSEEGDVPVSDEIEKNTSRPVVLTDKYTGDEDWLDWLTHFELCAKINDWDDKLKTAFLAVRLKRSAQQVYRDLPEATTKSYGDLKEALTKDLTPRSIRSDTNPSSSSLNVEKTKVFTS